MNHLRQLDVDQLKLVADDLMDILKSNHGNVRMMPYIFTCLDHLCSSGCLDPVFKSISESFFGLIRAEMSSGSKPLKVILLLIESIDIDYINRCFVNIQYVFVVTHIVDRSLLPPTAG